MFFVSIGCLLHQSVALFSVALAGQCVYSDTKGRHCNCADGDPENHCTHHHDEYLCDLLKCKEYDKKTWLKTGHSDTKFEAGQEMVSFDSEQRETSRHADFERV